MEYLIDLRSRITSVGDQGQRPACVSFALSACHEFVHGLPPLKLSKDALHWGCIRRDGARPGGVRVLTAIDVIKEDGQPLEDHWPYRGEIAEEEWLLLSPMDLDGASRYRISAINPVAATNPQNVARILNDYGPICLIIPIWESFFTPCDGRVRMPDTYTEEFRGNHALCVVGVTSEGELLVRNSWGDGSMLLS